MRPTRAAAGEDVGRAAAAVITGRADARRAANVRQGRAEEIIGRAITGDELGLLGPGIGAVLEDVDRARAVIITRRADQRRHAADRHGGAEAVIGCAVTGLQFRRLPPIRAAALEDIDRTGIGAQAVILRRANHQHVTRNRNRTAETLRRVFAIPGIQLGLLSPGVSALGVNVHHTGVLPNAVGERGRIAAADGAVGGLIRAKGDHQAAHGVDHFVGRDILPASITHVRNGHNVVAGIQQAEFPVSDVRSDIRIAHLNMIRAARQPGLPGADVSALHEIGHGIVNRFLIRDRNQRARRANHQRIAIPGQRLPERIGILRAHAIQFHLLPPRDHAIHQQHVQHERGQLHGGNVNRFDGHIAESFGAGQLESAQPGHDQRFQAAKVKGVAHDRHPTGARHGGAGAIVAHHNTVTDQAQRVANGVMLAAVEGDLDRSIRRRRGKIHEHQIIAAVAVERDHLLRGYFIGNIEGVVARAAVDGDRIAVGAIAQLEDIIAAAERERDVLHIAHICAHVHHARGWVRHVPERDRAV